MRFSRNTADSLHAPQSLIAAKVEHAMSEVAASSLSSSLRRPTNNDNSWAVQQKIWLLLSEIYLEQDQLVAATNCLQEAINISPFSQHIMYMVVKKFYIKPHIFIILLFRLTFILTERSHSRI